MPVTVDMTYGAVEKKLTVRLDGRPAGAYSAFFPLSVLPFGEWYGKVADACCTEANGPYLVNFRGSAIYAAALERLFQTDPLCIRFTHAESVIRPEHRICCLGELTEASAAKLPEFKIGLGPSVPAIRGLTRVGNRFCCTQARKAPFYLVPMAEGERYDGKILTARTVTEAEALAASDRSGSPALILVPDRTTGFLAMRNSSFIFGYASSGAELLCMTFLGDIALPVYLAEIESALRHLHGTGMSAGDEQIRRSVLLSDKPYLAVELPPRTEITAGASWKTAKYPADIPCTLSSLTPDVLQVGPGGHLDLFREGHAAIRLEVAADPECFADAHTQVYRYRAVQQIKLTAPSAGITEGDTFRVGAAFSPAGAHNTHLAKWETLPRGTARQISPGEFEALCPGKCTVVLSVEGVRASVDLTVLPRAKGVNFDEDRISVKLGSPSVTVQASPIPKDASYSRITFRVSDPSVIAFDSATGQITPLQEGDAEITAHIYDRNNRMVGQSSCRVSVLPAHTVYNPQPVEVVLILCALAMLILHRYPFRYVCGTAAILCAVWLMFRKAKPAAKILFGVMAVILTILMCI